MTDLGAIRGWVWMVRRFGLRRSFRYERLRRSGAKIDWLVAFTPDELARLAEHFDPVPWEQR